MIGGNFVSDVRMMRKPKIPRKNLKHFRGIKIKKLRGKEKSLIGKENPRKKSFFSSKETCETSNLKK